jgi:DNA ligase (NAD+)
MEDFENLDEIGAVTAKSLFTFFHDPAQGALIDRCLSLGVEPAPVAGPSGEAQPLAGRTVVISGTLSAPRAQWKERLERAGASVTGSVSRRTDFLLAGESPGSKLEAARKHGVTVLDEAGMNALLEEPA